MTHRQMSVTPLPIRREGEWVVVEAAISGHPYRRHRNGRLFFAVPEQYAAGLPLSGRAPDCHDFLARALVMSAMEGGCNLRVHGRVTTELLANLETYQRVIANWWPEYSRVDLSADVESSDVSANTESAADEAIMGFTGGMDSIHTLYCHNRRLRGRNNFRIPHAVFVHGFDIPDNDPNYDKAFRHIAPVATALGAQLIPVRTNLKRLLPYWLNVYPSALAAVLSLFSRRFRTGIIASSQEYQMPAPLADGCASYAVYDALFSSSEFRVFPDYADESRVKKTRVLQHCEVARRRLRVCWASDDVSGNCGRCGKCLRQMLALRACGIDDLSAFAVPLSSEHVRNMDAGQLYVWYELQACLEMARATGVAQTPEFIAVREVLAAAAEQHRATGAARLAGCYGPGNRETKPRIVRWAERLAGRHAGRRT